MAEQTMRKCRRCGKMTLHIGPSTSHVLHFLLSIVTLGVWLVIWLLVEISHKTSQQCTVCGKYVAGVG